MFPTINYIDTSNERNMEYLKKVLNNKELIYENEYQNKYNEEKIAFREYL